MQNKRKHNNKTKPPGTGPASAARRHSRPGKGIGLEPCRQWAIHLADEQRCGELYTQHLEWAASLAKRWGAPDPEDTASDAVIRAIRAYNPGIASFRTLLYRVVQHKCVSARRRRQNQCIRLDDVAHELEASTAGPHYMAELRDEIEFYLDLLAPEERHLLVMKYLHGLAYEEINRQIQ